MQIEVSNVLTVREPTEDMKAWCEKELTISNPEYAKKARMHFWTGNTPRTLSLYEKHGDDLILPFGTLNTIPHEIVQESVTCTAMFSPPTFIDYGEDVPLYDYQQTAVEKMFKAH